MSKRSVEQSERYQVIPSLNTAVGRWTGLLILFFALLTLPVAPAIGAPSHPFLEVFGSGAQPSFTTPLALAVDQSNGPTGGDLLVVDAGRNEKQRIVISEGSELLSGSYKLTFNGQTTGWTGNGTVTCNGTSTSITSVTTSTGAVAKGELISSAPGSCIKPNTTIVSCVPASCNSPTSLNISQATESNANSGVANLSADLNFSIPLANLQEALVKLPGIGTGNVTITESGSTSPVKRLVEFKNNLGASDVPTMTCDGSGLSAGATCLVETGTVSTPQGVIASLQRFKPDGTPHAFSGLGSNVIDGRSGPGGKPRAECESAPELSSCDETPQKRLIFSGAGEVQVAIAPSGSAGGTEGNIYVTQSNAAGGKLVDIFGSDGKYLGQLTQAGVTPLVEPCGVATDGTGGLFVGDFSKVYKYTPAANPPVNADSSTSFGAVAQPCSLAIGSGPSAGYFFVKRFTNSELFKIDVSTGVSQCLVGAGLKVVTTDPDTGHVYAGKSSEVIEYDASGSCATALSPTTAIPNVVEGIAVDKSSRTGNLYVSRAGSSSIEVYGPLQEPPEVTASPATGVTGAKATVNAKLLPQGSTVVECKFEYGVSVGYGSTAPCEEALPPSDFSAHDVSAELAGLLANGTTYHYRLVVKTSANLTVQSSDATFTTAITFFTNPASEVSDNSATLNGTVRLEGLPLSECVFEFGLSTSYGSSVPCSPDSSSIPSDSVDRAVAAALHDLAENSVYHFRLKASNAAGSIVGKDRTFRTLGKPEILEPAALLVSDTSATLHALINPRGSNTNYHFEYGVSPSYGSRAPIDFDLFAGSGTDPVKADVKLSSLQPGATYHYRVVASNASGTAESPDLVFKTLAGSCSNEVIRLEQGDLAATLPDCMALEMASPVRKYNQQASYPMVSASGGRISFHSIASLAETPSLDSLGLIDGAGEAYVTTRTGEGWNTDSTAPPAWVNSGWGNAEWFARSFTPDLSSWFLLGSSVENGDFAQGIGQLFRGGIGGAFQPVSPLLTPTDSGNHGRQNVTEATLQAVSTDSSHAYFNMGEPSAGYLAGDPNPSGVGADPNVYVAQLGPSGGPGELELLARDSTGKVWGGNCGARVGGMEGKDNTSSARDQGASSADGSRVYFSTHPAQVTNSIEGGPVPGSCSSSNKMRIMQRLELPAGPTITELVANECGRVSPPCKSEAEVNGNDSYQGASVDGSRVYFTTNRQLADSDIDGTSAECSKATGVSGCDLYLYDATEPAGSRLTQVSAGQDVVGLHEAGKDAGVFNGTVGISGDGSHVYFAAAGVLTSDLNPEGDLAEAGKANLYVFNADSETLSFVGTLADGDSGFLWGGAGTFKNRAYPVPVTGRDGSDREIGGDGHILFFQSSASLVTNDADGSRLDVYRYDADANPEPLVCISCLPGGPDAGPFDVANVQITFQGRKIGTEFAEVGRWASEDGATAVFRSAQALVPGAASGTGQGYMWRNGSLFLLPGSQGLAERQERDGPVLSHDGSTVAFRSSFRLLPQDGDSASDIYVARVDGGFEAQLEPAPCEGQACQGSPSSPPAGLVPGSSSYMGSGNVVQAPPAKKKGKHKHRKRGKKKRNKQEKRHLARSRASDNQGGRK